MTPQRYGAPIGHLADRLYIAARRLPGARRVFVLWEGDRTCCSLRLAWRVGFLDDAVWAVLWRALVLWIVIRTRGATWAQARQWLVDAIEEKQHSGRNQPVATVRR